MLCPRECHADRLHGEKGYCMVPGELYVARAALHMWEEPCISGTGGSGTVFFAGCNLRCVYCQNHGIARGEAGKKVTTGRLAEIFLELQEQGAANINLVTPTHYVPQIVSAIKQAKENGLWLPVVYNCGGYEKVETLRLLEGLVDIYLPDYKYMRKESGQRYSHVQDYPEVAKKAVAEMVRQTGAPFLDAETGLMKRGVIVRHMVLPGHVKEAGEVIYFLHKHFGESIYISIMSQYTPLGIVKEFPEINRKVTKREYEAVLTAAVECGVENGFFQEGEAAEESFIPEFDGEGV